MGIQGEGAIFKKDLKVLEGIQGVLQVSKAIITKPDPPIDMRNQRVCFELIVKELIGLFSLLISVLI